MIGDYQSTNHPSYHHGKVTADLLIVRFSLFCCKLVRHKLVCKKVLYSFCEIPIHSVVNIIAQTVIILLNASLNLPL